jgi:hypothetical protein
VSFVAGTLVPSLVAYWSGVFYQTQIERLFDQKQTTIPEYAKYRDRVDRFKSLVSRADEAISHRDLSHATDLADLLRARDYYAREGEKAQREFVAAPLFLNQLMLTWTAVYSCLGCIAFVLNPETIRQTSVTFWKTASALVAPYLLYQSPVWFRNFILNNEGRKVFSFANRDISFSAFLMQEVNTLLVFAILAIVW